MIACLATSPMLVGCQATDDSAGMRIEVRDQATRSAVSRARVTVQPMHFFVPVDMPPMRFPIIDPSPPPAVMGVTDAAGAVSLAVILDHPVQVIVTASGYQPFMHILEWNPARAGGTAWMDVEAESDPSAGGRLEVRCRPESP